MQLISKEKLLFELKPESLDDLWILSEFINPEDKIFSTTLRKIKVGNENSTKQIKKIIFVELLAKKIKFENETLRISGEILNETEFTAIGQNHSLNFSPNDTIKIEKKSLLKFEEKLLETAISTKKSKNLLILLDKEDLITAEFSDFSYKVISISSGLGSKKQYSHEINENEQKYSIIKELLNKDYSNIIFAGPGTPKESLKKYLEDKTAKKILSFSFSDITPNAIQKAIKEIAKKGIIEDTNLAEESQITEELLKNISQKSKYSYGYENTTNIVNEGKVSDLLITSKLIDKKKEDGTYKELNDIMKTCEQLNGKLHILSSKNEPGKIIDGLGGIASICRY